MLRRSFLATGLTLPALLGAADPKPAPKPTPTPKPAPKSAPKPSPAPKAPKFNPADWLFIDNGIVRLGVKKTSGAGLGWFSTSGEKATNLLDHYDHGRLVQQSYYGADDGSVWDKKKWRWNPVQGGDYKGNAAQVLALETPSKTEIYSKTTPRNWAGGELLSDVVMEQWILLRGAVAEMRFKFTYNGSASHPPRDQEIPAFFCPANLPNLVLYNSDKPWTDDPDLHRSKPGWPNEGRKLTEGWAAYVNDDDHGVGLFVPVAKRLTCYRFGSSPTAPSACSYFAPLEKFAITPGFVFDYRLYLTLGSIFEMRTRFHTIYDATKASSKPTSK